MKLWCGTGSNSRSPLKNHASTPFFISHIRSTRYLHHCRVVYPHLYIKDIKSLAMIYPHLEVDIAQGQSQEYFYLLGNSALLSFLHQRRTCYFLFSLLYTI